MNMKSIRLALAGGLALCGAACAHAQDLALDQVIDAHTAARGGAAAIESIQSAEFALDIVEPTFEVAGHYRATREGLMRIDIFAEGTRVFTEALDGREGWQMYDDDEVHPLSDEGRAALWRGIVSNLYGLHELEGLGYQLALGPMVDADNVSYITIYSTAPDGFEQQLFLDPESFQIVRQREQSALHPDLDPTVQYFETVYGNFTWVDGVTYSLHSEKRDIETGEVVQTTDIESINANVDLAEDEFEAPVAE